MIETIALVVALVSCPKTIIVNHTDEWTVKDRIQIRHSKKRCEEKYERSPCLKVFIKKATNNYQVLCGKPEVVK